MNVLYWKARKKIEQWNINFTFPYGINYDYHCHLSFAYYYSFDPLVASFRECALLCSLRVCIFYLSRRQLSICTGILICIERRHRNCVSGDYKQYENARAHTESPKAASHTSVLTPRAHTSCAWNKFLTRRRSAERERDALWKLRPTFIAHTKCVLAANYIQLTFPTNAALYKQRKSKEKQLLFTTSIYTRLIFASMCILICCSYIEPNISSHFLCAEMSCYSYNLGCSRNMCAPD